MGLKKISRRIWVGIAGFFIGGSLLVWINPLALCFFAATVMSGQGGLLAYGGILMGLAFSMPFLDVVRYSVAMLIIGMLINLKALIENRGNVWYMSFLTGLVAITANFCTYYLSGQAVSLVRMFGEGAMVFSVTVIFTHGINVIEKDYVKVVTDSQAALCVMALAAAVLYGMPVEVAETVVIAEAFALFSIMFANYKFGFGVGMSWTVIAASIMSAKVENQDYLTAWILVGIISVSLFAVFSGGRLVFAAIFCLVYYGLGMGLYEILLEENGLKALLTALFVFALAPPRLLLRVDDKVKNEELAENSPEWGRLVISRINALASAFKRIEYTMVKDAATGIGFNDVGEIIENFTNQLDKQVPLRKTIEARIIDELAIRDIQVKNLILVKNKEDRYEVYLTARVRRGRLVHAEVLRQIIQNEMKVEFLLKEESRSIVSRNYEVICFYQKPAFKCITAVRCLSKYEDEVSGDNFYIGDIHEGQKLIIIADGMGNGESAAMDSNSLIEAMEELLSAGFDQDMSIRLVNSYLSDKNRGESFSTLDMLLVDQHSGYGKLYKQGAATTFIKRNNWLEMVKSTSLPVGVVEGAVCEKCNKKFYNNDIIVMVSDGILESIIFENKEDYMREILLEMDSDEPEDIATDIISRIKGLSGNRLKDDATVIVCKLVKTL